MLELMDVEDEVACEVTTSNDYVPIELKFAVSGASDNFFLRLGDGRANLLEIRLTAEGKIVAVTLVAHRPTELILNDEISELASTDYGVPRFDVKNLYSQGAKYTDRFERPVELFVQKNSAKFCLLRKEARRFIKNGIATFGISDSGLLVSISVELTPMQKQALVDCYQTLNP